MIKLLADIGHWTHSWLAVIGRLTLFFGSAISHIFRPPFYGREFRNALLSIGYFSLPVVGLTAIFTGAALALQIYAGGARFFAEVATPQIVAIGMVRELGPVLVGLMIAARVTSSIAAEIATMKVTEQIDALVTLSTNPMKYLVAPRVLAAVIIVPVLVAIGDIIGILGGYIVGTQGLGFGSQVYLQNTIDFLEVSDISSSLIKGAAFGLITSVLGCYFGLNSGRGALGVGQATKSSVEAAAVLILAANFALTAVLFPVMIHLQNISKSFGENHVLQGVDLNIRKGDSAVIIGGSGTGKSVLLKCILGLVTPDAGQILYNDAPLTKANTGQFLNRFGMLFQGAALFDSLPIWENVAFRLLRGPNSLTKSKAKDLAISKLARVGLEADVADRLPAELSGGMQKRAGLARAIATDPEVIFFDEPTTGLDPIMASVINDLIAELVTEMGATAVTITHDMTTVRTVATHIHMLHEGRIIWSGSPKDLKNCKNAYVNQFINGDSEGPIPSVR